MDAGSPDLIVRPSLPSDVPDIVALADRVWLELYGRTGYVQAWMIEETMSLPGFDLERDATSVISTSGEMIAAGATVASPPFTEIICAPVYADQSLSAETYKYAVQAVIERMHSAALAQLADQPPSPDRKFGLMIHSADLRLVEHVRALGWELLRRHFEMAIELEGRADLPVPPAPDGITVSTMADAGGGLDDAALDVEVSIYREAFADHHGDVMDEETARIRYSSPAALPSCSYIASDAEGPVGFLGSADMGDGAGYIHTVAVRRRGRGRGIASALLERAFVDLARAGYPTAVLDVDGESLTGALGLYTRVGMETRMTNELWATPI